MFIVLISLLIALLFFFPELFTTDILIQSPGIALFLSSLMGVKQEAI